MKYSLIVLPFLASIAFAQDDLWKNLAKGDRVQITFRTGNMILGILDNRPVDPRVQVGVVDYSTVSEITLDVSLEYPGLNGTMTIPKKEIKEIRKIQNMDPATMKRIRDELKRIQQQAASDEAARKALEAEKDKANAAVRAAAIKSEEEGKNDKEKGVQLLKDYQDLQKAKEIVARFPPEKYGPQTMKEMADMAVRKQPIPPDIREFVEPETQRLWAIGVAAQKDAASKKEKEKVEEKKQ